MEKREMTVPKQLGQMAAAFAAVIHEIDEKKGADQSPDEKNRKKD